MLLVFERPPPTPLTIDEVRDEDGLNRDELLAPAAVAPDEEPLLPLGLTVLEQGAEEPKTTDEENWVEPLPEPPEQQGALASLFDRLADDSELYAPLGAADDDFTGPPPEPVAAPLVPEPEEVPERIVAITEEVVDEVPPELDAIAALIADANSDEPRAAEEPAPTTWRIVGRGFTPAIEAPATVEDEPSAPATLPDADTVERVSRYNFDELSRILTDRVSSQAPNSQEPAEQTSPAKPAPEGALINLSGETFILNRLPLGILVFRDQQVLFANRALTDLTGYESIESLRSAGLTAIFPSEDVSAAGPVTQLVRRDGTLAAVNARLQSITWHGRPALMLSASAAENRFGHEAAVRSFAQLAAETMDDGFLSADTSGTVTSISLHGRIVLGATEDEVIGKPLASFIDPGELTELRQFLERPARFAETSRPAILFTGAAPSTRVTLFAQGQAGIVTGYFAFLRRMPAPAAPAASPIRLEDAEPSMLTRISRSVRRPLNTVIGFSDLIRSAAFGAIENQRYLEYAQDIRTAGQEIATLIDELDDYSRLKDGRYEAQQDEIDLSSLLDASLARVRRRAGDARVLVRNAVSEQLPHITADRASLSQAILNLLASAIDQTPVGGSVILSAQRDDDGSIVINVRDSGDTRTDLGERFVVFRDGVGKDGEELRPVQSSVGLALTRSLLAVNALSLSVDPAAGSGNLFSLVVPPDLVRG
jgi:signal transduction histidine kinase